jgi:putative oxidoreductase
VAQAEAQRYHGGANPRCPAALLADSIHSGELPMPDHHADRVASERYGTGSNLAGFAPRMLSVLRIVAALIFLLHGTQKLFGIPPLTGGEAPAPWSLFWVGAVIELVAGGLILVGLFTRPAALIASGEMAAAYFMFHAPQNLYPTLNGGDASILYCFVFLYIFFAGPGPWSLDAMMRRGTASHPV